MTNTNNEDKKTVLPRIVETNRQSLMIAPFKAKNINQKLYIQGKGLTVDQVQKRQKCIQYMIHLVTIILEWKWKTVTPKLT